MDLSQAVEKAPTTNRAPNFDAEKTALVESVPERKDVLFGKLSRNLTYKQKQQAWEEDCSAVNSVSQNFRTAKDVKEKYNNL